MKTPIVRIPYKYGESINLKPVFDVHLGTPACDVAAFKSYMADSDKNTYFLLGGDTFDSIVVQVFPIGDTAQFGEILLGKLLKNS